MSLDIEARRIILANKTKMILAVVISALIAPVILLANLSLWGLIALGITWLAAINAAPWVSMKFANWKLAAMKAEARQNPIETRQNVALERTDRLSQVAAGIEAFGAEVRNVADQVKDLRRNGQPDDADELERELKELQADFNDQLASLGEARNALDAYKEETVRLGRRWKAALALLKAKGASGKDVTKELEKLVSQEATDAVNTKMNQAFASLDVDRASRRRLQSNPSPVLDVQSVRVNEKART